MDLEHARALYVRLTADLARSGLELEAARSIADRIAQHYAKTARETGAAISAPRGSALEAEYLEKLEQRARGHALASKEAPDAIY